MTAELRHARHRALLRRGRPMTLRRLVTPPDTYVSAAVTGFSADYAPDDLAPPLVQGDRRLEILHADLVAAGFPWPPREPDEVAVMMQGLSRLKLAGTCTMRATFF